MIETENIAKPNKRNNSENRISSNYNNDPFYKFRNQTLSQDEIYYTKFQNENTNNMINYNINDLLKFKEKKVKNNID